MAQNKSIYSHFLIGCLLLVIAGFFSGCTEDRRGINPRQPLQKGDLIYGGPVAMWISELKTRTYITRDYSYVYKGIEKGGKQLAIRFEYKDNKRVRDRATSEADNFLVPLDENKQGYFEIGPIRQIKSPAKHLLLTVVDDQGRITAKEV